MSGNDPFDPFGQNERTIIRPNPGGRAPQQPQQGYPQQGGQPGNQPPPPRPEHQQYQDFMQPMGGPAPQQGQQAQWGQQQPQWNQRPPQNGPSNLVPMPGKNPLLTAAGSLLDLLGRLRNAMTQASFSALKQSISREIEGFEAAATSAGAYQQQLWHAKYALCSVADDIVQNLPGEDRYVWTQDPMLGRYFGERIGGTKFYDYVDEALRNPGANYDLLELYYVCLSLGFEGKHRASPQGQAAVHACRNEIYQALRGVNRGGGWLLSPHWKGMDIGRRSIGMQIPFWAVAALVAMLLTGGYFGLRYLLTDQAYDLTDEIASIHPNTGIELTQPVMAATPVVRIDNGPKEYVRPQIADDPGQLDRIRATLKAEIDKGLVEARYLDANFIIVRFSNELLFPSGSADVTEEFRNGLARRLGETFGKETELLKAKGLRHGRVFAVGHSDAQRLSATSKWSSNYELSEARAKSVMDAILANSPPDLRTRIEGRGPDDPVCTPAKDTSCWPQNRRVELLIERTK